jgi:hypothetical protein
LQITPQGIFQDDYVIEQRRASSPPSLGLIGKKKSQIILHLKKLCIFDSIK